MKWKFIPISDKAKVNDFDCGSEPLNTFLKSFAFQNQKGKLGTTIVAIPEGQSASVAGYYTVSPAEIVFTSLPANRQHGPKTSRGAMRIGRLAVDKSAQGQGLGKELLIDALRRAIRIDKEMSLYAVVVDAKAGAEKFYLKFGFIPYLDKPESLFLPMKTIAKLNL